MADETHSQLHQGAILEGAGGDQSSWLDPERINILADPKPIIADSDEKARAIEDAGREALDHSYMGQAKRIIQTAQEAGVTLRLAVDRFGDWRSQFAGSPEPFPGFHEEVVPILQARGLFHTEYAHDTLRGHLGLPVPENRYSAIMPSPATVAAE